ncbi:hypothetical protein [Mucilaginibacter sp. OK098]|uniref:hypothetical protein n=1 Tax=Mucilaginibacter sp. OK098 TaxID=1855297 RepID=UPI000916635C|nr:hypothetical protein [Mucilaginibacter sp. OK098]SHN33601.1 hypothetical protein SAMN05216524_110111 [Mucilaginibacter sp. OK098]
MGNKYKLIYLLLIAVIAITSCTKEGLQGPDGATGPAGPTGATGPAGPAGKDGSVIYSGSGVPVATNGSPGDYYLNKATGDLYGPKTVSGWGSPIGLNGANGTNGTNGSVVYSGNGSPLVTLGNVGDYYLDKTNILLYGPKTTSWGTPVLLRGAQGAQGPAGPAGTDGSIIYSGNGTPDTGLGKAGDYYFDKSTGNLYGPKTARGWGTATALTGATGATGAAGANGSTILNGSGAPPLSQGTIGDFYLDKSTYLFYGPKNAGGWGIPVLLKGAQGVQGPIGPAGADGSIIYSGTGVPDVGLGKNGDYYIDKSTGGLYGPKTARGWGSPTSLKGANGSNGTDGTDGSTILSGSGAPIATQGNTGDFYLDKNTYLFYGPKSATGWGIPVLLKGAEGVQGPVGPAGADGSIIYSGNGTPDPRIGVAGDYYFDKTNGALYGPKTNNGWGLPTSLVGPQGNKGSNGSNGTNGKDGNTILSGTGVPSAAIGNIGDFYLDTSTFLFYGPKSNSGWGTGTSLKAASGGASVTAFETADNTTLTWAPPAGPIGTSGPPSSFVLRQQKITGDTSTVFKLPDSLADVVNHGIVLVYLHVVSSDASASNWIQLSYTNIIVPSNIQSYTFKLIVNANGVFVRIACNISNTTTQLSPQFNVDKVRVVVVPEKTTGQLGSIKKNGPVRINMQQLPINNNSFKKLK